MEKTDLTYHHKINECEHTFTEGKNFGEMHINPTHTSIWAGKKCEFCGHGIAWAWSIIDETGKVWEVGSECVFNLLNLDKEKQKSYKALMSKIGRLERCRKKYADILNFLKDNIKTTSLWDMYQEGRYKLQKNDDYKRYHKKEEDCYQVISPSYSVFNMTETELKERICDKHPFGSEDTAFRCANCCALEIIRKIEQVGTLNEFWLSKYEELSGLKLPERN